MKIINLFISCLCLFKIIPAFSQNIYELNLEKSDKPVVFSIDENNNISFLSFPNQMKGTLNFQTTSIGAFYPRGITKQNCEIVKTRAKNSINSFFPEMTRTEQKNLVRKYNTVNVFLDSGVNFNSGSFKKQILEKAAKVNDSDISHFFIDDNFKIEKITYSIEYESHAISNIIDNKDEFKIQIDNFIGQPLFLTGTQVTELASSDLICDLYFGNAKLKMNVYGKYGKQNIVSHLLENSEIELVYQNILDHSKEYYDMSLYNAKNKNLILSTLFLKESLTKIGKESLDYNTFLSIFDEIISSQTGKVLENLDHENLYKKMEKQEIKPINYFGEVSYDVKYP